MNQYLAKQKAELLNFDAGRNPRTAYERLVKRFANGRPICNCGEAYYSLCNNTLPTPDNPEGLNYACEYGCSANKLIARDEIAALVESQLE